MRTILNFAGLQASRVKDERERDRSWFSSLETISRLEQARPIACCLGTGDFTRLRELQRTRVDGGPLYRWLLRAKLADAPVLWPQDVPASMATTGSRLAFRIGDGQTSRATLTFAHIPDGTSNRISVQTVLGLTLLGMRVGQTAPVPLSGGKVSTISFLAVMPSTSVGQPTEDGRDVHRGDEA